MGELVAKEFLGWRDQKKEQTLAGGFEELRRICEEENYALEIPPRQERHNPFPDALAELDR